MNLSLNICDIPIRISVWNGLIEKYIYNRFSGFISSQEIDHSQKSLSLMEINRDHINDIIPKINSINIDKEYQEINMDGCKYYAIKDDNIIFYDKFQRRVYFSLCEAEEERILYFIGVKLCEIIVSHLIENNIYCIHSSVCTLDSNAHNGVAFLGQSGVGKTSLAYQMYKCGEQLTNDDVGFFRITPSELVTFKNMQHIGLDDYSIKQVFPECERFVSHKDGLTLDKNRVDLGKLSTNAFAEKIIVKQILIVDSTRQSVPEIVECSSIESYKTIVQSLLPFFTVKRYDLIDKIAKEIISMIPVYKLIPGDSIMKTVSFILAERRLANGNWKCTN